MNGGRGRAQGDVPDVPAARTGSAGSGRVEEAEGKMTEGSFSSQSRTIPTIEGSLGAQRHKFAVKAGN